MKPLNFNLENRLAVIPKVLLADTTRWAGATRLALGLSKVGIGVVVVCPSRHPILKTRKRFTTFHYSSVRPEQSLLAAIEASQPDIVVPCDERAAHHLRELHMHASSRGTLNSALATLIERSLGQPKSYPIVSARYKFLEVAREEGLRVPETQKVEVVDDLKSWGITHPFPWVLKADGTWGGGGVKIVHTLQEAQQSFLALRRLFNVRRVLTKLCLKRDLFWLRPWWTGVRPAVTVQSHIDGRPANCAFVCWRGKVDALIGVEAVSTLDQTGPASVVRLVDNCEMMHAAEKLALRLGLSGLFGLDFIVDSSGAAHLIEMNPRYTPLCHLQLGPGQDMIEALRAQLSVSANYEVSAQTRHGMIALFPQAWLCKSEFLTESFQDIPEDEPELVRELLEPWPNRSILYRASNGVRHVRTVVRELMNGNFAYGGRSEQ
jgi:hypothetical protein